MYVSVSCKKHLEHTSGALGILSDCFLKLGLIDKLSLIGCAGVILIIPPLFGIVFQIYIKSYSETEFQSINLSSSSNPPVSCSICSGNYGTDDDGWLVGVFMAYQLL